MAEWIGFAVTILCSVLASSGIWALIQKRMDRKSAQAKMVLGLGHDRIMFVAMSYINKGWISKDEYENLHDYLYMPYIALGGNGAAKRIMAEVDRLPIRTKPPDTHDNLTELERRDS